MARKRCGPVGCRWMPRCLSGLANVPPEECSHPRHGVPMAGINQAPIQIVATPPVTWPSCIAPRKRPAGRDSGLGYRCIATSQLTGTSLCQFKPREVPRPCRKEDTLMGTGWCPTCTYTCWGTGVKLPLPRAEWDCGTTRVKNPHHLRTVLDIDCSSIFCFTWITRAGHWWAAVCTPFGLHLLAQVACPSK